MLFDHNKTVQRLGIFFLSDKNGTIDHSAANLLADMANHLTKLMLVHPAPLTPASLTLLEPIPHLLVHAPDATLAEGYLAGMEKYGWDELTKLDELVLWSDSLYGPFHPFAHTFETANGMDLDFWGLVSYNGREAAPHWNGSEIPSIPAYLPTHFIGIRQPMLQAPAFKAYWATKPNFSNLPEEYGFTLHFASLGYQWGTSIDTSNIPQATPHPLLQMPLELVKNRQCPVVMKDVFIQDMGPTLETSMGEKAYELFRYLKEETHYNTDLILENLLRTCNAADLKNSLQWNYFLPSHPALAPSLKHQPKVALLLHIYYEDQIEYCFSYAKSIPTYADVYITTSAQTTKTKIEQVFSRLECNKLTVTLIPNKGQDVSALLVAGKEHIQQYDYVCYAHDKKGSNITAPSIGVSFAYLCFESILKSRSYVEHILNTFEENPRLGMLSSPNPIHGSYFVTLGYEWTLNFDTCVTLAKKLGLTVDMHQDKSPIAPLGSEFWFRPKALKPLFDYGFHYEDFPPSGSATETLLNAIERIHPFVVQNQGYYPGWVMPPNIAAMELTNMNYYLREMHRAFGIQDSGYGAPFDFQLANMKEYRMAAVHNRDHIEKQNQEILQLQQRVAQLQNTAVTPASSSDVALKPEEMTISQLFNSPTSKKFRIKLGIRALMPQRLYRFFTKK